MYELKPCQDLLGLSYLDPRVLCVGMGVGSRGRFEGHGAYRAFVEDLTVGTLEVRLEGSHVSVDDAAVYTAGEQREGETERDRNKGEKNTFKRHP